MKFECAHECYCDCEGCSFYGCQACLNVQCCFNAYTWSCPNDLDDGDDEYENK